jgi:hypothetical protein
MKQNTINKKARRAKFAKLYMNLIRGGALR